MYIHSKTLFQPCLPSPFSCNSDDTKVKYFYGFICFWGLAQPGKVYFFPSCQDWETSVFIYYFSFLKGVSYLFKQLKETDRETIYPPMTSFNLPNGNNKQNCATPKLETGTASLSPTRMVGVQIQAWEIGRIGGLQ